jgi:exopolyphosphatase/pppGpp-phosphohydrolase
MPYPLPTTIPRHSQHPPFGSGHTLARNLSLGVSFIGIHLKAAIARIKHKSESKKNFYSRISRYSRLNISLIALLNTGCVLAVRADAFTVSKIRPHQLMLVHNDRQLAVNSHQHQQIRCSNKIDKMNLHRVSSLERNGLSKQNRSAM